MAVQTVFKRRELKYLLSLRQKETVLREMAGHLKPDIHGRTTVRNLYYDTDAFLLIRRSIEKPVFKEKLRLRSYERAERGTPVFVELKRKYDHIVYKRRICLPEREAEAWLKGELPCLPDSQICREVEYFRSLYGTLHPVVFLSYEREAYAAAQEPGVRLTFDDRILCRQEGLSLREDIGGAPILPEDTVLMEIKASGGMPLWMAELLSREHIYKTSFSKYGTAYKDLIFPQLT